MPHCHTEHEQPQTQTRSRRTRRARQTEAAPRPGFYASPAEAMKAPREEFMYVVGLHTGTGVDEPDFLAVVDVNPESDTYSRIIHRMPMPYKGDELHHFGWQVCSSACHTTTLERKYLVIPGFGSSRIYIVDVGTDPRRPGIAKVIEPREVISRANLTWPHTVHCMPGDIVTISMLGDSREELPGGFLVLDAKDFNVLGRWEQKNGDQFINYDFWYQPRKNVMVSSEFGVPNAFKGGFKLEDVSAGRYGRAIHFWDLEKRERIQKIDLGETGLIPLEVRWLHNPDAEEGYVAAALSSTVWHFFKQDGSWKVEKVIEVPPVELPGWPFPVPSLITDQLISMDDRFLYFANWLHGDIRQYDITDRSHPRLTGQVILPGVRHKVTHAGRELNGGPNMLQLSMDGRRLYATSSLLSSWDNQFYPGHRSWMVKININPNGGMELDPNFFVDFYPARAHEMHIPGGDCTTEIFS